MDRRRRTEILIKGSEALAYKLAKEIEEKYQIRGIEGPHNGLVMVKMREGAKNSLFYLGEVLVTEAKVQVNGKLGIGIIRGDREALSYALAVIDAAYHADLEETKKWNQILIEEEKKIYQQRMQEQSKILMTKVSFDTMDV
ncbi:MAG: phosphonate C-P lyase system protein PhnG [Thermotaleaceae bacterium]